MKRHNSRSNNNHKRLLPPMIVETPDDAAMLHQALKDARRLAVDTESNSLYAYTARVCLIQISTDYEDFLVDPLKLDLAEHTPFLGQMMADPGVEIVFHAAEYDIMMLHRDFGWTFDNLFDTMIAARVLGWEKVGLGSILEDRYGVHVDKKHQRANWGKRPLTPKLIRYAQMDTHYLLDLRDHLHSLLEAGNHVEEARELYAEETRARWSGDDFDPDGYWSISSARDLNGHEMAVLRELYLWRDQEARQRDIPVFKVMGDRVLVALAEAKPRTRSEAQHISGISGWILDHYGEDILAAIQRGLNAQPPKKPRRNNDRPNEDVLRRYDVLHTWRKERGSKRGVSSEIVVSKDALWEMARSNPQTLEDLGALDSIGPWRTRTYGPEILEVLSGVE